MLNYRITKFNPTKRDKNGFYTDNSEWTAITDIENPNYSVSFEEYVKVENAYVESILLILQEKGINKLTSKSVELHSSEKDFEKYKKEISLKNLTVNYETEIANLKNGSVISMSKIDKVIRLILREIIWLSLVDTKIEIEFGYDYYMYVKCEELSQETIGQIEKLGLFVEPNIDRIEFTIFDENDNE